MSKQLNSAYTTLTKNSKFFDRLEIIWTPPFGTCFVHFMLHLVVWMYGNGVKIPPGAVSFCIQGAKLLIAPNEACDITGVSIAAGQAGIL